MRKSKKLFALLATLALLATMLVPMVTPAAASSTYTAPAPQVINNDTRQGLGTIQIDIPQVTAGTSSILVTLPTDFEIDWSLNPGPPAVPNSPLVTVGKAGSGAFTAACLVAGNAAGNDGTHYWNDGIIYVSDREFKVIYTATAVDIDYDVRLLVTLPNILIPASADGDVKVTIDKLAGDFSGGSVVVGKAGSGAVDVYVNNTVSFTDSGTNARQVEVYLKENSKGAVKVDPTTVKLKLPKGMSWSNAAGQAPVVTNLSTGAAGDLTVAVGADERVLEVTRAAIVDGKSIYKVSGTILVDEDEAVLGDVIVGVSGASSVTSSSVTVGEYLDYSVKLVVKEDAKNVVAGRLAQEVADFNIEEGAKGSISNNRSITMELPEGVKWSSLTASSTGSLTMGAINPVGTTGRKIKFTATNTGTSKGKFKFENVEVDVAVDFTGDIKVKVNGAGVDNQEAVIGTAPAALTATATTPEVKIGMQNQAGGVVKIVEGAKETLINGKDLVVTAPDGVKWYKTPTVEVTEGDLSIDVNGITKSGRVLTIPIKSQSTTASTIEISDVLFTVDRTVPEGNITLEIGGSAIDEVNDPEETLGPPIIARAFYTVPTDGLIFDGRDVAAEVDSAVTITPAPGETKPAGTVVFKIGDTNFTVGGVEQTMDAAPYIKDGRTFLPVRYVAQACGVSADNILYSDGKVTLIKGDKVIQLAIGSDMMLINGISIKMDVAAEITNGRTMLPFRWIAQALGASVSFDEAAQTVTLEM